ncbi:hypothetical protein Cgig2_009991 [Carnegiea gigantea]|uniref:Nucleoside phosphorylase domain-containing protein n=1 Tax=Carnegiea gigantea TaxID=171969 RepID=A0A9Q1Q8I7_9CARY|nr:hypothetical protein Cgig2_009991 [Carnegiea gigantea]
MGRSSSTRVSLLFLLHVSMVIQQQAQGEIPQNTRILIDKANAEGPYIGVVIPNPFELEPLLQSPAFHGSSIIDFAGRRFRFGAMAGKKVILVMTGLAMVNAGVTTQLLLSLFNVKGVVHYGIAGNANPSFHVGDVTIPRYWAHIGLWNWQRYGQGVEDELALEAQGDYSREYGNIRFADYTTNTKRCINATTCISTTPRVATVLRGASASIFVDNAAYRASLYDNFNVTPIEMESAGVALICHQQKVPFITIRALSDLAGGGSAESNEADTFLPLASTNSVLVVEEFIKKLDYYSVYVQ